eukprot:3240859-Alexandrium_andersonii.AAC.1
MPSGAEGSSTSGQSGGSLARSDPGPALVVRDPHLSRERPYPGSQQHRGRGLAPARRRPAPGRPRRPTST